MHLGPYSLLLLVAAANGWLLAILLLLPTGRHTGSRLLAALVATIALRTAPYILGFAGAYDAMPALTFAPFDWTLAWGPLLWMYVTTLAQGTRPDRWRRHLVPLGAQIGYQLVCFALPIDRKWSWYTGVHLHLVEPIGAVLVLASLAAYAAASWRVFERWQQWLEANVSNREESRLDWLRTILLAIAAMGAMGAVMMVVHVTGRPLDYFARLPIIVVLAGLTYLLGLLGAQFGREAIPMRPPTGFEQADEVASPASSSAPPGYREQAMRWRELIVSERWHHDPQLTLTSLALRLGTSGRTLSRTLNDGLDVSFNAFINALRVEDAVQRLRQPGAPDVLRVAMDVGFASKASFNRAFKLHTGTTPSAVRAGASLGASGGFTTQNAPIGTLAPAESND